MQGDADGLSASERLAVASRMVEYSLGNGRKQIMEREILERLARIEALLEDDDRQVRMAAFVGTRTLELVAVTIKRAGTLTDMSGTELVAFVEEVIRICAQEATMAQP